MPVKKFLRIGIDCRLSGKEHAGIGRYVQNLVSNLIKIVPGKELLPITWVLFFFSQSQANEILGSNRQRRNVEVIITPIRHYGLAEQFQLHHYFQKANLDLLHVPHFNVPLAYHGNLVITIHDLLWHEQKGAHVTTLSPIFYYIKYAAYRFICRQAFRKAKKIFVPSQTIKTTALKFFPFAEKKIVVTPEGLAEPYLAELSKKVTRSSFIKKQLIYTGSLYPHKNLQLVIESLKKLPQYNLLIVGARNVFQDRIRQLVARFKVKQQVQFLGYVPDQELITLYQQSAALVQPSLSEGFGLTGIEAMASKTLVLASDIPIFREIYQDAAIYFDPLSNESFIEAVQSLDYIQRKEKITTGLSLAQHYSWQAMALVCFENYQEVL